MLAGEALTHHEHRELTEGDSQAEIRALVKALAEADGDTYRHSLEVAATARVVGELLDLTPAEIVEVELGALLHDVGKLRLPPHILGKPGRSTRTSADWCDCTPSGGPRWSAASRGSRRWRCRSPSPRASRRHRVSARPFARAHPDGQPHRLRV